MKQFLFGLVMAFWAHFAIANVGYGSMHLKEMQLHHYHHAGNLKLTTVEVAGDLEVHGKLTAQTFNLHNLLINGMAHFKDGHVSGDVVVNGHFECERVLFDKGLTINGLMKAEQSTFDGPMQVAASELHFEESVLNHSLTVQHALGEKIQLLILESSTIRGNVLFQSGHGLIKMDKSSKILGQIIGAKIVE